ncbi:hypothetical protein MATL_G00261800 [Megalops atlanticus]|uniref:Inter-alpha-trypsin inhibitor heavy chain H5 n=1 Tax=Megalops atlanticus TaxID=7932 RepID=A0A9D3PCH1_MEGAT|nr:hypothetical protein MATL_G00261800 [Megalops atlanticus]
MDINLFLSVVFLLLCFAPLGSGQYEDIDLEDDIFPNSDLSTVPLRVRRQIKTLMNKETKPHIQELSVKTTVISRYAVTSVSCTMLNRHSTATEGVFPFQIPAAAYISNFTMIIGGKVYPGEIRPKEKKVKLVKEGGAKPQKEREGGESEGDVEAFRVAVSVPAKSQAVFLLTYEQLLQRWLGGYELVTSLRPQQLVSRLSVQVTVADHARITQLEVLPLQNEKSAATASSGAKTQAKPTPPVSTVIQRNRTSCKISFSPSIVQQAKIATSGNLGDFIVRYEVERELGIGDIQFLNGHFVHYLAPKNLPVVPKNVVFVIDTSASMMGTKIRQTKEALFAILRDLNPNDRFNLVSFSSRVKVCQPGQLMTVTPNNIRDAKKFIYMMTPSGGADINGAIQTSSALLSTQVSSPGARPNSVSVILLLTDGRPTVGELESPRILSNTRAAVQERLCVFTVGIGKDVDYRLLERMAAENCGRTRRIMQESHTKDTLKRFYDGIGSPLLTDIQVGYTEGSVQDVTRSHFTNYFNGSEMVIAGKLTNQSSESVHIEVTASSSGRRLVLEADVALRQTRAGQGQAFSNRQTGYAERLWGLLAVKDGLRSRRHSQTRREREELGRQVTNLSLAYNLLTPLTRMVLETADAQLHGNVPENSATTDLSEETIGDLAQSLHRKTEQPGTSVGKPIKKSITISKTSADGDPHFVVEFPLSKLTVCFNINGEPGHVLRLVSDHENSGVTVNGKLIGAPAPAHSHKQQRTYFSTITVVVAQPKRAYIEITPRKVILDATDRMILPCDTTAAVETDGLGVAIVGRANVTVTVQGTIAFVILVHQYKNPAPYQRDHLGFYISNSKGLSKHSHGLLGQFLYQEVGLITPPLSDTVPDHSLAPPPDPALKIKERTVSVVRKSRKLYNGRQKVDCWFVRNNADKLIDGHYEDYVVPHLFDTGNGLHKTNGN